MASALTATHGTINRMAQGWQRVWTDQQKDAVAVAYVDRGIRPYRRIQELGKAGELEYDGGRLEPFTMPIPTMRTCVDQLRRRRAGVIGDQLADRPDAIEVLRKRLINAAEAELRAWERGKVGNRDMERHRQIARALREAAALPTINEPRPVKPGQRIPGEARLNGGETHGGLAGQILQAHQRGETAQDAEKTQTHGDSSTTQDAAQGTGAAHTLKDAETVALRGAQDAEHVVALPT